MPPIVQLTDVLLFSLKAELRAAVFLALEEQEKVLRGKRFPDVDMTTYMNNSRLIKKHFKMRVTGAGEMA